MATIVNQKKAIQSLTKEIDDLKMRNNSLSCGRMAHFAFPPQNVPSSSRVVRAPIVASIDDLPRSLRAARPTPYDQTRGPPSYS